MELGLLRREWELLSIDQAEAAELQRRGIICCDELSGSFLCLRRTQLRRISPSAINRCALKTTTQDFSARILEGIDRFLGEGFDASEVALLGLPHPRFGPPRWSDRRVAVIAIGTCTSPLAHSLSDARQIGRSRERLLRIRAAYLASNCTRSSVGKSGDRAVRASCPHP